MREGSGMFTVSRYGAMFTVTDHAGDGYGLFRTEREADQVALALNGGDAVIDASVVYVDEQGNPIDDEE